MLIFILNKGPFVMHSTLRDVLTLAVPDDYQQIWEMRGDYQGYWLLMPANGHYIQWGYMTTALYGFPCTG